MTTVILSERSRLRRWQATTRTWLLKAVALTLQATREARSEDERWLVGYDANELAGAALDAAEGLIPVLNDEDVQGLRERVSGLQGRLRDRALASKLANTAGRTDAEAETFQQKAEELRAR